MAVDDVAHEEMGEALAKRARSAGASTPPTSPTARQVDELVERVESDLGPLDVVASNAGVADWQPFTEITRRVVRPDRRAST